MDIEEGGDKTQKEVMQMFEMKGERGIVRRDKSRRKELEEKNSSQLKE